MKKYIFSAAVFLLVAGVANAQMASKQPVKTDHSMSKMTMKPAAHATSGNSSAKTATTTTTTQKKTTTGMALKRKHHYKKGNSPKKTESK
jgi:hypothetical protein